MSGREALWLEDPLLLPAPPANATFTAGSVPSMIQEIRVMKNNCWQRFGARKGYFLTSLPGYYGLSLHFPIRFIHSLAAGILVYLLSGRHD